jgi:hypothetical protein
MQNNQLAMINYQSLNSAIRNPQSTNFSYFGDDLFGLEVSQTDGTRRASGITGSASLTEGFVNCHDLSIRIEFQSPKFADLFTETATGTERDIHHSRDRFNPHLSYEEGNGCP